MTLLTSGDKGFRTSGGGHIDRRHGFLQWAGQQPDIIGSVKLPLMRENFVRPRFLNDLQRLAEALTTLFHGLVKAIVDEFDKPPPDAEVQSSSAQQIEQGIVFCQANWIVMGQQSNGYSDPHLFGALGKSHR